MTEAQYRKCMEWTEKRIGSGRVRMLVRLLTAVTAACYGITVLWLFFQRDSRVLRILLLPAAGLLAVSLLRRVLMAERPYERYGFTPLLEKHTKGNSFPSRHVFSNFIIGLAVMSVWPLPGAALLLAGILLAVLRVVTGVHFPKDVLAGALLAILIGGIGFF